MDLNIFDSYNLRARLSVIAFYAAPFVIDVFFITGQKFSLTENIILTLITVVICQCLLNICRSKKDSAKVNYAASYLQPNSGLSTETRKRYYRKLASFEPEFRIFACDESEWNERISYDLCRSVIAWLSSKTRDKKVFHLVYEENINYGYHRNMRNLKKLGIIFNIIALFILFLSIWLPYLETLKQSTVKYVISMSVHILEIAYLCVCITKNSVNVSAKRYARALIETIDII